MFADNQTSEQNREKKKRWVRYKYRCRVTDRFKLARCHSYSHRSLGRISTRILRNLVLKWKARTRTHAYHHITAATNINRIGNLAFKVEEDTFFFSICIRCKEKICSQIDNKLCLATQPVFWNFIVHFLSSSTLLYIFVRFLVQVLFASFIFLFSRICHLSITPKAYGWTDDDDRWSPINRV